MIIHNIFSVPIYEHESNFDEIFLIQNEIKNKLPEILETDKFENPPLWNDGVKTNIKARYNSIADFELKNLQNFIDKHVNNYIKLSDCWIPVPIKLTHSWINFTNKDEGQDWHQHQDATISGCYYYQTSETDGDIIFETPNPFVKLEIFPYGQTVQKYENKKPKVGKIILFPSWLNHKVEKNTTNESRISIAFNYYRDHWGFSKP